MRSASATIAAAALAAAGLAGCADSTQTRNARAKLGAERELAARKPQRVTRGNPAVRVEDVGLVRGARGAAIVVALRSNATRPLTDVPIAVGVRTRRGERRLLNAAPRLGWFSTHVPAIPARGRTTWVFRTHRAVPTGSRPFARAGLAATPPLSHATSLPVLRAAPEAPARGRAARVTVHNASDVPQTAVQVYATTRRDGRWVAAGRFATGPLAPGASATVTVPLTGRPRGGAVRFEASPTIFD